jgi:hypothetical protein
MSGSLSHAYFTGADDPYDKLKRALRAESDEAAWSSLYSTVSRPFDKLTVELKPAALSAADQKLLQEKSQRDNAASE